MHVFGRETLRLAQQISVETELEDGPRSCFTGKLGIDGLIRPTSKRTRDLDAPKNIGAPYPSLMRQSGLRDDRCAALHSGVRLSNGLSCDFYTIDAEDGQTCLLKMGDIAQLVGRPAFR